MKWTKRINIKTIGLHSLFWVGVWFFFFYFFSYNSNDKVYITWFSSALLPLTLAVTYFVNYFLIPRFLLTKQYFRFGLYLFYTLVVSSYLIVLVLYTCLIFLLGFNTTIMPPMSKNFLFILMLVYLIVGVVSFVGLLMNNFKTLSYNKELQEKILETQLKMKEQELHYLKQQIHPHFLFNTLNTIYGFAMKQSQQTPDIILKLSNLLDYILYQVSKPRVSLKEEVLHIKEYIDLEKIRFQDTLKVSFVSSDIDKSIQVAPMLLIPFIENAFKHGNIVDGFLSLEVGIKANDDQLKFKVRNTVYDQESTPTKGGIGLENSKKRLDLNYKNNYDLQYGHIGNWYHVELNISNLNQNKDG